MEDFVKAKRNRKPNFSNEETKILLRELAIEKNTVLSTLSNDETNRAKRRVWERIRVKVNACGVANRTVHELKDKWGCLKRSIGHRKEERTKPTKPEVIDKRSMSPSEFKPIIFGILGKSSTDPEAYATNSSDSTLHTPPASTAENLPVTSKLESPPIKQDPDTYVIVKTTDGSSDEEVEIHFTLPPDAESAPHTPTQNPSPVEELDFNETGELFAGRPTSITSKVTEKPPKKFTESHKRRKALSLELNDADDSDLFCAYLRSEIEKNQSIIDKHRSDIEANIEEKEVRELKKQKLRLEIQILQKSADDIVAGKESQLDLV